MAGLVAQLDAAEIELAQLRRGRHVAGGGGGLRHRLGARGQRSVRLRQRHRQLLQDHHLPAGACMPVVYAVFFQIHYRVTYLVANLGWVDLDL